MISVIKATTAIIIIIIIIIIIKRTASVEFLATNPEVPGSIFGSTRFL
jgi:hypothetical protein